MRCPNGKLRHIFQFDYTIIFIYLIHSGYSDAPPNGGAEPPCSWRSAMILDIETLQTHTPSSGILDSKVGSSDWLGGPIFA